MTEGEGVCRRG